MTDTRRPPSSIINLLPRHTTHSTTPNTFGQDSAPVTSAYMDSFVARLQQILDGINNPATLRGGGLILSQPLEHNSSLQVGDVYVDGEGHLRIRQSGWPLVDSQTITATLASVTITIV